MPCPTAIVKPGILPGKLERELHASVINSRELPPFLVYSNDGDQLSIIETERTQEVPGHLPVKMAGRLLTACGRGAKRNTDGTFSVFQKSSTEGPSTVYQRLQD